MSKSRITFKGRVCFRCIEAVSVSVRGGQLDDSLDFPVLRHIVGTEVEISVLSSAGEVCNSRRKKLF